MRTAKDIMSFILVKISGHVVLTATDIMSFILVKISGHVVRTAMDIVSFYASVELYKLDVQCNS